MRPAPTAQRGFTLIEMSIVLVIIGLIVGGVLVGQDLIRAAEVRAQISQIEKYNMAVNTFRGKYNAIPGDMNVASAQQFGFAVGTGCTGIQGQRDGNGVLDAWAAVANPDYDTWQTAGEVGLFWQDLSSSAAGNLIDGSFHGSGSTITCQAVGGITTAALPNYFPPAKIGGGNFVYVYQSNNVNWYGILAFSAADGNGALMPYGGNFTIPVIQAYSIDKKVDDGLPTTGNVQANFVYGYTTLSNSPNAASDSATTCYNTTGPAYSIAQNGGTGANCALSFRFQ